MTDFASITGALGSIIGYLGAEVAGGVIFERLLWPQRFYNDFTFVIGLKLVLFMPMGGPLHRAALKTLDTFQNHGLYRGRQRGVMLGTAFYDDMGIKYSGRTIQNEENIAKEGRNGFWIRIAQSLVHGCPKTHGDGKRVAAAVPSSPPKRARVPLHYITLTQHDTTRTSSDTAVCVREDGLGWQCWIGIVCSELTAIAAALTASVWLHCTWVAVYFCLPLLFKLVSVLISVNREPLKTAGTKDNESIHIFEIDDLTHGLVLVESPEFVMRQYHRHYGHPHRDSTTSGRSDHVRELLSIALVYLFVVYFPVGLIALLWMPQKVQYLWLGYQLYTVLAMHTARLAGLCSVGRTEECVARHFERGVEVVLRSHTGLSVRARAETVWYDGVGEGRVAVKEILESWLSRTQSIVAEGKVDTLDRAEGGKQTLSE